MADPVEAYYSLVDRNEYVSLVELFSLDCVYERPGFAAIQGRSELLTFYRHERQISSGLHTIELIVREIFK